MYTPRKLPVCDDQYDKLMNEIAHQKPISIKLNLDHGGGGEHTLLLTGGQIARIERSRLIGKHKLTIPLSKRQVKANVQNQGGFLGMLGGLAAKALPSILGGLTIGLVSSAVKQAIGGNGLYLHKLGHCLKIDPVRGNGLYLTPHKRLSGVHDDGLYLKRGLTIQDGPGLILGPNSPCKNILILYQSTLSSLLLTVTEITSWLMCFVIEVHLLLMANQVHVDLEDQMDQKEILGRVAVVVVVVSMACVDGYLIWY